MKSNEFNVLTVIIANPEYPLTYSNYTSRVHTESESEKIYGYNTYPVFNLNHHHIVPRLNPFFMYAEAIKLQQHLKKHSYDAVHFYFEYPGMTKLDKGYWQSMFSLAFAIGNKSGLNPYFFTDSGYDIPLRQVTNGIFYNIPSVEYSDYLDSLYYR